MNSLTYLRRALCLTAFVELLTVTTVLGQMPEPEVRKRLDFIYNGQAERVRIELPSLQKQYPNDPGIMYLDAILTTDGAAAVKKFQSIVDDYPQNEWADDALYKVYQYYYSVGLYKTADQKFDQLKQQYPNSLYVVGLTQEQKPAAPRPEQTVEQKQPDTIQAPPAEQPSVTEPAPAQPTDTVAAAVTPGKFAVQAGAFGTEKNAQKQVDFLGTIGRKATVGTKMSAGKTLYIVLVEGFATEMDARNFIAELKSKYNIESIIVAK